MTIDQISKEMREQNHRITQNVLFVIMDTVKKLAPEGCCDGTNRRDDNDFESMCNSCQRLENDGEKVPNWCEHCDSSCFWDYIEEEEPQLKYGVFFTAKACEECIAANHYHFNKPKSYGIGAWRNYEMQQVQQHLLSLTGEIPNHYK